MCQLALGNRREGFIGDRLDSVVVNVERAINAEQLPEAARGKGVREKVNATFC
jgi:hypothetical protein